MALDQITAGIITSAVRVAIALLIFWIYFKNKNKLALYFGLFFVLFSIHGWFRTLSVMTEQPAWYFVHRLALTFGTIMILQGLTYIGVDWIKKYKVVFIAAVFSVAASYYDAYVSGGVAGEQANIMAFLPSFSIGGIGLIIAGYYFFILGGDMPDFGKNLMAAGFILEGLLHFAVVLMIPAGLTGLAFYLGLTFTALIGIGWWMSLKIRAE